MYILKTETTFDSAHFLSGYNGKCSNLHGHTWRICAEICAEELEQSGQRRGMVTDFGDLKAVLGTIADEFDHTLIYEKGSLSQGLTDALKAEGFSLTEVDFRPTAENFAEYFYARLENCGFCTKRVSVYETPKNCAVYEK